MSDAYDAENWALLGELNFREGKREQAEAAFREAVRLFRYNPFHRYALAVVLWSMGRNEEAAAELRVILEDRDAFSRAFWEKEKVERLFQSAEAALKRLEQGGATR